MVVVTVVVGDVAVAVITMVGAEVAAIGKAWRHRTAGTSFAEARPVGGLLPLVAAGGLR